MPPKKPVAGAKPKPIASAKPKGKFAEAGSKEEKRRVEAIKKTRGSVGKSGLTNSAVVSQPKKPKSTRPVRTNLNVKQIALPKDLWRPTPEKRQAYEESVYSQGPVDGKVVTYGDYIKMVDTERMKQAGKKGLAQEKELKRVQKLITAKPKKKK